MQMAVNAMSEIIANLSFNEPEIPIVGNTTAQPLDTAALIKEELLQQLCNCVQWQRSVEHMVVNDVSTFIEIGPGKVLTGLIKRINRSVKLINIGDAESVKNTSIC